RADLPSQAGLAVLDHHDRGNRRGGADLDDLRDGSLVGADRPRRQLGGDPIACLRLAASHCAPWRPDRTARCRRLRHQEAGNVNRILSRAHADEVDVHQLNCTYYSALACDDERYVAARAIQLFARGIPQIYYAGLLAGENDLAAVENTGDGRAINRHDYTTEEISSALQRPVVGRVVELVRLRN